MPIESKFGCVYILLILNKFEYSLFLAKGYFHLLKTIYHNSVEISVNAEKSNGISHSSIEIRISNLEAG